MGFHQPQSSYDEISHFLSVYLRPFLDRRRVHALLPHTLQVRQQDMVRRLPKPALGEQLAAADVRREPGLLREVCGGGSATGDLHRRPEISYKQNTLTGSKDLDIVRALKALPLQA